MRSGAATSDALHLAGLQHAQQLGLQPDRHVGDFVEEQRALVCHLETADAVVAGVGEGPLDVAEQLALGDALGEAAGVHGDEGPRSALGQPVHPGGGHFLAGAVLAGDQDRRVRRRDPLDGLADLLHAARVADERRHRAPLQPGVRGLEALVAAQRPAQIDLGADGEQQPLVVPGLLDVVARAAPHRFDRRRRATGVMTSTGRGDRRREPLHEVGLLPRGRSRV